MERRSKTSCHQLAHRRLLVLVPSARKMRYRRLLRNADMSPSTHSADVRPSVCYGFTRGRRPLPCGGCLLIQSRADPLFSESECARFNPSLKRNIKSIQERCVGRLWLFLTIVFSDLTNLTCWVKLFFPNTVQLLINHFVKRCRYIQSNHTSEQRTT